MSLRINHNTSSLNAHRNLEKNNSRVSKSLQRLSSGMRINTAGDGPSTLVASEQMRAQISSIEQAIRNSEASVSMVQTAEGALSEVNSMLVGMRQLAIHAANEGANDDVMLEADQREITNMISSIDRISNSTEFGSKKLLDGSNGISGTAIGEGLEFVSAITNTQSSGSEGFEVVIKQNATQASLSGSTALTKEMIAAGEKLTISEGGRNASYVTKANDTVESAIQNLSAASRRAGLEVTVKLNESNNVELLHNLYGSDHTFEASSSTAGVLSAVAGKFTRASTGMDLQGTINGEATVGKGNTMTGITGNRMSDGLTVRYRGNPKLQIAAEGTAVGSVSVSNNALTFQVGPGEGQTVRIALNNTAGNQMSRGVPNKSNFESLVDIDVSTAIGAQDAMNLIDDAINQVTKMRADLGSFQKNTLETNIANMRTASENMVAAESSIRDTDFALEIASFTRNELMMQSAAAMLAQANQVPKKVLNLLIE